MENHSSILKGCSNKKPTSAITLTNSKELNTRLASFKPPRDLTLKSVGYVPLAKNNSTITAGATKPVFTPNLNVVRRKGANASSTPTVILPKATENKKAGRTNSKKPSRKGNFIQTHGVFSEGLAPGKLKDRAYSDSSSAHTSAILEKPKLNLNRVINKSVEDEHLKKLLKDDFVDNPKAVPNLRDVPLVLPQIYANKINESYNMDLAFQQLQLKMQPESIGKSLKSSKEEDIIEYFQNSDHQKKFVFEFPHDFLDEARRHIEKEATKEKLGKTEGKSDKVDNNTVKNNKLFQEGEGRWGSLKFYSNGKAYITFGSFKMEVLPIHHNVNKQHIFSTSVDPVTSRGSIKYDGPVDAGFTLSLAYDTPR